MAEDKSRYNEPSRTYEFVFKVGKKDITNDVYKVTILTSIDVPYQTFIIELLIDANDLIVEEIYGQKPLELTCTLLATQAFPQETTKFELMYLSSEMPLNIKVDLPQGKQKDRVPIVITAVAKKAYKTMNYFINEIIQAKKIPDIIQTLVSKTGATLKLDSYGQNKSILDQVLVPPSTLYKSLEYINRTFGIFDGMPAIFCSYDNTVYVKNLARKMKDSQAFTVYQLSLDTDNSKTIKKCSDGKNFYTIRNIDTTYRGNSIFAVLAPKLTFVVKPRDRLAYNIDINLETFAKNHGLISKSDKIFYDKTSISEDSRVTVYKDHTGYDLTQTFINANLTKDIGHITEASVVLEQSLRILNLMNVGESVEIISPTAETTKVIGRYILRRTELSFSKARDWSSSALLTLIRTNRTSS